MKKWNLLFILIILCSISSAQDSTSFQFPKFKNATIIFNNGGQSPEKINYNLIDQCLYFIDRADNTMKVVTSIDIISSILIDNKKYLINSNGMMELLADTPQIYVQIKAKTKTKARTIGYGGTDGTASVNTYSEFRSGGQLSTLKSATYEVTQLYKIYWIKKNNKMKLVSSFKHLLNVYKSNSVKIQNYIDSNKIDFENINEFVELVKYAESL